MIWGDESGAPHDNIRRIMHHYLPLTATAHVLPVNSFYFAHMAIPMLLTRKSQSRLDPALSDKAHINRMNLKF